MAVIDAHVFPGFLTLVLTQISFQSHQVLFTHASADVGGQNAPERKFASTRYQTQVYSIKEVLIKHVTSKDISITVDWLIN